MPSSRWLALQVAWGRGYEDADQSGALQTLAGESYGPALLWLIAVGLVALTIWRASEAIWARLRRHARSKKARGLDGAMRTIAAQPFGQSLLAAGAPGLRGIRRLRTRPGAVPPDVIVICL